MKAPSVQLLLAESLSHLGIQVSPSSVSVLLGFAGALCVQPPISGRKGGKEMEWKLRPLGSPPAWEALGQLSSGPAYLIGL